MSVQDEIDYDFYASFYEDLKGLAGDKFKLHEHYLKIGKDQGRVVNTECLAKQLCDLLHFDADIYANLNLGVSLRFTIKEHNPNNKNVMDVLNHLKWSVSDVNRYRIKNSNDLLEVNNEWNGLYKAIDERVKFDLAFYTQYYDIPVPQTSRMNVFLYWVCNGLFLGQAPNEMYLFEKDKLFNDVMEVLVKNNVDINYITNEYSEIMNTFMTTNNLPVISNLGQVENMVYLFMNTGNRLRLFLNANERNEYIELHKNEYSLAEEAIKTLKKDELLKKVNAEYDKKTAKLVRIEKNVQFAESVVKLLDAKMLNSVSNLKKLTDKKFLEKFKKCHGLEKMGDVALKLLSHEMKKYENLDKKSMEVKHFIVNFMYNANIDDKKDKNEYMATIKQMSMDLIKTVLSNPELESTIEQDIEFFITNKKIIKLCKLAYTLMPLLI